MEQYKGIAGVYRYKASTERVVDLLARWNNDIANYDKETIDNVPSFYYLIGDMENTTSIRQYAKEIGLTELKMVEAFVGQLLGQNPYLAFINEENNAAFVVANSTSYALFHVTISFISLFYPKLFKDHPLTKQEAEACRGLTLKNQTTFVNNISTLLQPIKSELLRKELADCFKGFRQGQIDKCRFDIDNVSSRIDSLMTDYHYLVNKYNELMVQFEGLQVVNANNQTEEEKEAIEFLSECPRLHDIEYKDGTLYFYADNLLTNFDLNKWRNAIRRNNIYDNYRIGSQNVFHMKKNRMLLFDNIFCDKPLLYVRMKGQIELRITQCDMVAPRGQIGAEHESFLKDYVTNPHFKVHGCLGRNREQIIQCLRRADIESAVECSIASVGSINIDETEYTFRPFLQEVLTSTNKIIETKDGEQMTPEEALLWLSKQNAKVATEQEPEDTLNF